MLSLILPSKQGGYPGFRSGKLTQENDDFSYADVDRHTRSIQMYLVPPFIASGCVIMLLFCLLNSANRVFEDTECNEFQTVMFLCFLSGACHIPVLFSLSRVYFVCCGYLTSKADRLSVEEYQIRLEAFFLDYPRCTHSTWS
ncbi:hypothetical protein Agabi119p4_9434 [Agaricus bisporus var. burnettii]|uniref:Uncharacterized protein n=1 Tax=Agaricus bisporus var. burnettii TaxID=192524 RepID=A0A8H7EX13_AGABI|nr:hypothetical protein Agabi119p4_9434 [Agaricus bisporus var. burnettii]